MNMRDATTGRLMWRSSDWDIGEMFTREIRGSFILLLLSMYIENC